MTDTYTSSPEDRIDNLAKDAYVLATVARQGRLNVKSSDELVSRLRSAAADMVYDGDRELLHTAAEAFERLGLRIKAGAGVRTRAKASARTPAPAPQPDWGALARQQDLRDMASAGPFDRAEYEDVERKRSENANAVLRERQRKLEASRRQQVAQEQPTERPWWR